MDGSLRFEPRYDKSWALVVGINEYDRAQKLDSAVSDAKGVADAIKNLFGIQEEQITRLLNGEATKHRILSSFLRYAGDEVSEDDRIVIFFAGHGLTQPGRRGQSGFLVPVDGDPKDLSTLIRWDELTRNADLIPAKHLFFIMDACYGGLAASRSIPPGSTRFLRDMLKRYSRQVLTAGKADEPVADSGGPRAGHSVFTGHLLEALGGAAAGKDGIISANGVMGYVYDRVSKDPHSMQSPHFGFIEGDGDLIFSTLAIEDLEKGDSKKGDADLMIETPITLDQIPDQGSDSDTLAAMVKEYLSDPKMRIRLDDLVTMELRAVVHSTTENDLPVAAGTARTQTEVDRVGAYEKIVDRLLTVSILISKWSTEEQAAILRKIVERLADNNDRGDGGLVTFLNLRWYPLLLTLYSCGIAALSSENYRSLSTLFLTNISSRITGRENQAVIVPVVGRVASENNTFNLLSGPNEHYAPRSEYLFKRIQPRLDDLLFLGRGYEELFDRFEVFLALVYADQCSRESFWGPPGRFAWKYHSSLYTTNPLDELAAEAKLRGEGWPPLQHGFFGGSWERFHDVVETYRNTVLNKLPWY